MTPWLDDGDIRLFHGDALETVRQLPSDSVDCVVTSPPYWGLRDYGTGEWDGGDPDCDHQEVPPQNREGRETPGGRGGTFPTTERAFKDVCGKCGARRVDRQMGLEPTPDLFVTNIVELFREIRRVLAPHGTCWVNLGDSYAANVGGNPDGTETKGGVAGHVPNAWGGGTQTPVKRPPGLKPKDLVGIPWRVAFALQADGWWLRSDIIWAKPNPMPESVTDRPTKAHEYIFLLTKQPRYWFDAEAVRETGAGRTDLGHMTRYAPARVQSPNAGPWANDGGEKEANGRNVRSVWQIATQPYPEAHFATYPEELARRCILAGCPIRVCRVCGKPSERIVERNVRLTRPIPNSKFREGYDGEHKTKEGLEGRPETTTTTVGWSECECRPLPLMFQTDQTAKWRAGVVLDPFIGSGTTAKVARDHQRHAIGIDLNQEYLELAARRLQQLSLLA